MVAYANTLQVWVETPFHKKNLVRGRVRAEIEFYLRSDPGEADFYLFAITTIEGPPWWMELRFRGSPGLKWALLTNDWSAELGTHYHTVAEAATTMVGFYPGEKYRVRLEYARDGSDHATVTIVNVTRDIVAEIVDMGPWLADIIGEPFSYLYGSGTDTTCVSPIVLSEDVS